jgi:CheY-like chemotaxis protein
VRGDKGQLEQVLMNLVVNARDAMPDGGLLTISTSNVLLEDARAATLEIPAGEYVEIDVVDSGTGMDEATRARIFEPFFTTKEIGRGTGLGLSTVFGIVKQSRGAIDVETAPRRGTRFRIYLPRDEGRPTQVARSVAPSPGTRGAHGTILVVEDEAALRNVVVRMLRHEGYEVLAASGPDEALRVMRAQGQRVNLLLTDVIMPGGNGRDLARSWQAEYPAIAVLFMSGYANVLDGGAIPATQLLHKPFDRKRLCEKVRGALGGTP